MSAGEWRERLSWCAAAPECSADGAPGDESAPAAACPHHCCPGAGASGDLMNLQENRADENMSMGPLSKQINNDLYQEKKNVMKGFEQDFNFLSFNCVSLILLYNNLVIMTTGSF